MPRAATRPSPPSERPEPRRETLHLGWAPSRRIAPLAPSSGPRAAEAAAASGSASGPAASAKSPKSPPPIKGQTGPRPGY